MTEKEYNICIGTILAGKPLDVTLAHSFVETLVEFESMLDDADSDDYFGSEGWRHMVGWD